MIFTGVRDEYLNYMEVKSLIGTQLKTELSTSMNMAGLIHSTKIISQSFRGDSTKKMIIGEGDFSPSSHDYNIQQVPCDWSSTVHKVFFYKMDIVPL